MTEDLTEDVRAVVDEALQRRIDEVTRRREDRRADRARRAAARTAGLRARHAAKLARITNGR